jgi:RNA polymerase sigma-70 factor (ECF subfamily)
MDNDFSRTEAPKSIAMLMAERDRLYAYIWAIVGDVHLAEDVFQEVSLFVIEKRPEVVEPDQFRVWLRRTARYKSLEAVRRVKKSPVALSDSVLEMLEDSWDRYDSTSDVCLVELLHECMQTLTPNGQQMITLRHVEGLHSREIAEKLGRQVESVYQAIARAHQRLMECVRSKLPVKASSRHDD